MRQNVKGLKDISKLKFEMCARHGVLSLVTTLYEVLGGHAYVLCHHILPHSKITGQPHSFTKTFLMHFCFCALAFFSRDKTYRMPQFQSKRFSYSRTPTA